MASIYDKASLVMIPSGTKASKIFSQKPTNGDGDFTFSRSTAATRVNADGNIEKETQNLLLQSNSFNTTWTKSTAITATSGQSGYDGSTDAWLLERSDGSARYIQQSVSLSGVNTFSFYAKADNENWVFVATSSGNAQCYYNLSNGSIGTKGSLVVDANAEDIGSGWYRVSMTINGTFTYVRIYPAVGNESVSGATDASIFIQDSQIEQGLVARDYIETTTAAVEGGITDNVPRLDYTDSSCPALLLEPQRQNIVNSSEYFEQSGTYNFISCILTANDATSPEGYNNAYSMVANTTNGTHYFYHRTDPNLVQGQDYSMSIFVKANGYNRCHLTFNNNDGTFATDRAIFNLSNGSIVSQDSDLFNVDITPFGNGWYRVQASCEALASADGTLLFGIVDDSNNLVFSGNGTDGLYIYGYQVERVDASTGASYTSSYIPTYGSAVTRNGEDVINTNTSGIIGQVDGMIYLEMSALGDDGTFRQVTLSDGTSSNLIHFDYSSSSNGLRVFTRKSGVASSFTYTMTDTTSNAKFALKYADNDYRLFINGVKVATNTTCLTPLNLSDIEFDNGSGSNNLEARLNQFMIFPTALTDQEAIDLTTL